MVAHVVWDHGVGSSNLSARTSGNKQRNPKVAAWGIMVSELAIHLAWVKNNSVECLCGWTIKNRPYIRE